MCYGVVDDNSLKYNISVVMSGPPPVHHDHGRSRYIKHSMLPLSSPYSSSDDSVCVELNLLMRRVMMMMYLKLMRRREKSFSLLEALLVCSV